MIIDGHTHAYEPEDRLTLEFKLGLLDGNLPEGSPHTWRLVHPADLASLAGHERAAGVDRFVLLPVASKRTRVGELNRWAAQAAREDPAVIPFATLHPLAPDPLADLNEAVFLDLQGIKLHSLLQRFHLLSRESLTLLAAVAETGRPVLLDTLHGPGLIRAKPHLAAFADEFGPYATDPAQVAELARRLPSLRIIAAHLGCLYGWEEVGPLHDLANVYLDLAYVDRLLTPEAALALIRRHGPERIIWGTDCPWREVGPALAWFRGLGLRDGEEKMILGENLLNLINRSSEHQSARNHE